MQIFSQIYKDFIYKALVCYYWDPELPYIVNGLHL